jgi:serine/threonine-protein kinase RsbW
MRKHLKIESRISNLNVVESTLDQVSSEIGLNRECYGKVMVSTLEAVNNAIIHGNNSDPDKNVDIEFNFAKKELQVQITDEGNGFMPQDIPDPTKPENIEALNGRGVFLMTKLSDNIEFSKKGNSVKMTFKNIID